MKLTQSHIDTVVKDNFEKGFYGELKDKVVEIPFRELDALEGMLGTYKKRAEEAEAILDHIGWGRTIV